MKTGLSYYFTNYGEVYAGIDWYLGDATHKIIIQADKVAAFRNLKGFNLSDIHKYGWRIPKDVIVEVPIDKAYFQPNAYNGVIKGFYQQLEHKTMFIFGAGASAHCVFGEATEKFEADLLRPPMGPDLFDSRFEDYYTKYKGVKASLTRLQRDRLLTNINNNVEDFFESEWESISQDGNQLVQHRHINILYYLQELLRDVSTNVENKYYHKNLYSLLGNKLQKIHAARTKTNYGVRSSVNFAFVSFNQDSILENLVGSQFGLEFQSMNDYIRINASPCYFFKPHGSWNWGWRFPNAEIFEGNTATWIYDNKLNLFQIYYEYLGNPYQMVDWHSYGFERVLNKHYVGKYTIDKSKLEIIKHDDLNNYFPAILLPYRDKDEFTMPREHFSYMKSYFNHVETLIIIGWKGNEEAFNKQLFNQGNRITKVIIADPNPELVIQNIDALLKKRNIMPILYKNFEDFVFNGVEVELSD